MMTLRERRFPGGESEDTTRVLIDDPSVKVNPQKTHGLWVLFVSAETRDEVIQGLQKGVESGQFTLVGYDEALVDTDGSKSSVFAMEEGYVTRRTLKVRLAAFGLMGFDGSWIYCDTGAERHQSARRALCGKSPRSPVTELDFRGGGDEPIVREARLPKK